jgi:hypothetical protein
MNTNHILPVYVTAAAALSRFGPAWRGLLQQIRASTAPLPAARQLQASHGAVPAAEVPPLAPHIDVEPRARKLMSYPARLAAAALGQLLQATGWTPQQREDCGFYLGVGASGAQMAEIDAMLAASIVDHEFDLARFGQHGLAACNPLFAFQLMNNFTLCHGAILHGVGGANSALFSRGIGTVDALEEAHWLLACGSAERAIAGGADSALHPATWSQLQRDGLAAQGLLPGEGVGLLALCNRLPQTDASAPEAASALALLAHCESHCAKAWQAAPDLLAQRLAALEFDALVLAPWGVPARKALRLGLQAFLASRAGLSAPAVLDISPALGDALAASPALAWCVALDWLAQAAAAPLSPRSVLVLSAGTDGGLGLVLFRSVP